MAGLLGQTHASDKDAVVGTTLTGTLVCVQCQLHQHSSKAHQDVLLVNDGNKEVEYYVACLPKHPNLCHQRLQNVKVTGIVEEKDGKKWLTASKLELPAK